MLRIPMTSWTVPAIERGLRQRVAQGIPDHAVRWRAAVAIILRDRGHGLEVLVIRRAERAGDRWSGDAALPGGKASPGDASLEATAMRETLEEVGLDLRSARVLGRLSDHPRGRFQRWARWSVTPVVFAFTGDPPLVLDPREVAWAGWVSLAALRDPRHQERFTHWWQPVRTLPLRVPMRLTRWNVAPLTIWGLTQSMLEDLLSLAES